MLHPMEQQQHTRAISTQLVGAEERPPQLPLCLKCGKQPARFVYYCKSCADKVLSRAGLEVELKQDPIKWLIRQFQTKLPYQWAHVKETVRKYGLPPK